MGQYWSNAEATHATQPAAGQRQDAGRTLGRRGPRGATHVDPVTVPDPGPADLGCVGDP